MRTALACVLLLVCASAGASGAGVHGSELRARGQCGPFPRAMVTTPAYMCVGIVAGPEHGLAWPRNILEIGDGRFAVADAVGWSARGKGRVLELAVDEEGGARVRGLIEGRNLPHGLAMGPDGRVYVGDDDAIWRFDPGARRPVAEQVLAGLPGKPSRGGDHWHPMKQIVFDRGGQLVVNFGAPQDGCDRMPGVRERFPFPCPISDGEAPDAALWQLEIDAKSGAPGSFKPIARGLRNSMAIAVHESGLIVQAENNFDRWGGRLRAEEPPEEINLIEPGAHYGWPYCSGFGEVVPEYRREYKGRKALDCSLYADPLLLMPAHAAPLAMAYYIGAMFPELRGKLLIALHGRPRSGPSIVAYETDAVGRPIAPKGATKRRAVFPEVVVNKSGRRSGERSGVRPSGMTIARDGSIWLVDDKSQVIMVLLRSDEGKGSLSAPILEAVGVDDGSHAPAEVRLGPPANWAQFYGGTLKPNCGGCHEALSRTGPAAAWREAVALGFVSPENLASSRFVKAMRGEGGERLMPPGKGPAPEVLQALADFLESRGAD